MQIFPAYHFSKDHLLKLVFTSSFFHSGLSGITSLQKLFFCTVKRDQRPLAQPVYFGSLAQPKQRLRNIYRRYLSSFPCATCNTSLVFSMKATSGRLLNPDIHRVFTNVTGLSESFLIYPAPWGALSHREQMYKLLQVKHFTIEYWEQSCNEL